MVVGQMAKKKERRLDKMLAATLVGDINFDTAQNILPKPHDSWVHFPEAETLKWFSDLVDKLWYHIDAATHKVRATPIANRPVTGAATVLTLTAIPVTSDTGCHSAVVRDAKKWTRISSILVSEKPPFRLQGRW